MMQKFWDTAMATSPVAEDDETRRLLAVLLLHYRVFNLLLIILTRNRWWCSENSFRYVNDAESLKSMPYPSSTLPNTFGFKIQDRRGRMHRFICGMHSILFLITSGGKLCWLAGWLTGQNGFIFWYAQVGLYWPKAHFVQNFWVKYN